MKKQTTKISKEISEKAFALGVNQFKSGGSAVPAYCQELNDWMTELNLGIGQGGLEIMKSFQNGWHRACDEHILPEMFETLITR